MNHTLFASVAILLLSVAITTGTRAESPNLLPAAPYPESNPGQARVSVTIDGNDVQAQVPPDFEGLSFEAAMLPPNQQGSHYFDAKNEPLVRLFKTLGIKSLRIGGATVDNPNLNPTDADIDSLFGFARAAGVKVIYSFRLKDADSEYMQMATRQARYILDHYSANLDCFALGNEPNQYLGAYNNFKLHWLPFFNMIEAGCPNARVCGPGAWPAQEGFAVNFSHDFAHTKNVALITQHEYPFSSSTANPDPVKDWAKMLSVNGYDRIYNLFVPEVLRQGFSYRIEETNSFSVGGVAGASNAYAASLWGLDYLHWWAAHQAAGINFHTGYHSPNLRRPFNYSVFSSSPTGNTALPLAYAMLAFKLGSQGRLVKTEVDVAQGTTAYAVSAGQTDYVTIVNKNFGLKAVDENVTVSFAGALSIDKAEECRLTAINGDVSAQEGITLGGAGIGQDGNWSGKWVVFARPARPNVLAVKVPAASALVLRVSGHFPTNVPGS